MSQKKNSYNVEYKTVPQVCDEVATIMASERSTPASHGNGISNVGAVLKDEKPIAKASSQVSETKESSSEEDKKEEEKEYDPVTDAIGAFGCWQLKLTFLLSLLNCPCTWHIFAPTFESLEGDFMCAPLKDLEPLIKQQNLSWRNLSQTTTDSKGNSHFDPCNIWNVDYSSIIFGGPPYNIPNNATKKPCHRWDFDETETGRTIISQWSLVCTREYLRNVADMTFLMGVALGGVISGLLSDRFGRKKTLMASLSLQIIIGTILAGTPWLELYVILRFLLGFVSVSIVFSGFVICMEIVGGKWRTISGVSYLFPVPLSYIAIAGIAYLVRGWMYLQLAITLPAILLLLLWWVIPESPRWLLAMGRTEEVLVILRKAAEENKMPPPPSADKFIAEMNSNSFNTIKEGSEEEARPKPGFLDLFRTPNIRRNSLLLYVLWFVLYFVYYGLVLNLSNIGGNIYVNTALSGAVELPAIAFCILFLLKMGRRWPLCLSMLGSGVSCLLTLTVPQGKDYEWVTVMMAMMGKFSISTSNAMLPVFTAELFPTVVRNLGVGSSNIPAGIALMLVPYLWYLSNVRVGLPMGTLGALGLIGGMSVLFLPETANSCMPQTIEEGEELAGKRKYQKKLEKEKKSKMKNAATNVA